MSILDKSRNKKITVNESDPKIEINNWLAQISGLLTAAGIDNDMSVSFRMEGEPEDMPAVLVWGDDGKRTLITADSCDLDNAEGLLLSLIRIEGSDSEEQSFSRWTIPFVSSSDDLRRIFKYLRVFEAVCDDDDLIMEDDILPSYAMELPRYNGLMHLLARIDAEPSLEIDDDGRRCIVVEDTDYTIRLYYTSLGDDGNRWLLSVILTDKDGKEHQYHILEYGELNSPEEYGTLFEIILTSRRLNPA